jgi:hypothetical protein
MITNVARFARCLKPYNNGMLQIKYYHEGIGTSDGKKQSVDSATGASTDATSDLRDWQVLTLPKAFTVTYKTRTTSYASTMSLKMRYTSLGSLGVLLQHAP